MPPVFPSLDEAPKAPVFPRLDKEPVFPDLEEDESSWDYLFRKGRQTAAIADEEPPPPPQVPEPQLYSSFGATAAPPKFGASEFKPPMTRERMATRGAALKRYGFDPDAGTTEDERAAARGLQPANVIMSPTGQKYVPADNLVDAAGQRIGGIASAHLPRQVQRALLRGVDAMGVSNLAPDDGSWTDTIDPHRTGELGGLYNISRNIPETVKDVAEYGAEQVQRPFRGEAPEAPEWLQNAWETTKGHFTGPQGDTRDGWTAPWEMGWWGPESAAEAENMWGKTWETVRHLPQFPIQMYNLIAGSERPSHKAQGIAEIPGGIAHSMYDTGKTAALHGPGGTFSKKGLIQPFIDASIGAELGAAGLRSAGRARIMKAESELGRNAEIARNAEPNWGANPADLRDYANDLITGKQGGKAPPDFTHGEVVADYGGGLKMVRLPESGGVVEYGLVHNNRLIGRGQASRAVEDGLGDVARPTRPGEGTLGLDQIAVLPEFKGMGFGQKILSEMNKDGVDLTRNMRTEGMVSPNAIAAQRRFHETNQSPFEFKEEVIPEKSLVPYEYSDVGLGRGKLEYVHEAAPKVAARAAEWAERASEAQEAQAAAAAEIGAQQKALDVANKSLETGKLEPELAAAGRAALKDAQREARKGLEPKTRPTPEDILLKRERELGSKPAEELSPEGRARHEELRAEWVEAKTPRKTHEPTAVPDKTQLSKPYQTAEYLRETINDIRQAGKEQAEGAAKSAEAGLEAAQKWHEAASKDATRLTAEAGRLKQLASDLEASIHRELVPHVRKNLSARHQRMLKQAETLENTAKALELSKHLLNPLAPLLAINWIKNLYIGRRHKSGKHTPESTAKMLWALRAGDRPGLAKFREEQRLAEREVNDWYLQMSKDMSTIAEENQGTVYEMMHQENYFSQFALEQWVEINPFAEAGQRVKLREGVKDVPPEVQGWVDVAREADWMYERSHKLTKESLELDILAPGKGRKMLADSTLQEVITELGLDQAWMANEYTRMGVRAKLKERLLEEGRPITEVNEILLNYGAKRGKTEHVQGVEGAAERPRTLRGEPIKKKIEGHGMSPRLDENVFGGMLEQKRDIATARMWQTLAKDPSQVSRVHKQGWLKIENKERPDTKGTLEYPGLPKDFWVKPDIAAEMVGAQVLSRMRGKLAEWTVYWKHGKTVFSPATHVTNFVGNALFMAPIAGVGPMNPLTWPIHAKVAAEFLDTKGGRRKGFGRLVEEGLREGLMGPRNALNRAEYQDAIESVGLYYHGVFGRLKDLGRQTVLYGASKLGEAGAKVVDRLMGGATGTMVRNPKIIGPGGKELIASFVNAARATYNAGDMYWRTVGYHYWRKVKGLSAKEAVAKARKGFADYENMPGFLQVLSVLPVGVPFMAFNARAAVSIGEFFSKSPVRAAAYEQVWKYVTDQNLKLSMIGKDEIEEQRKMMPAYDRWRMTALGGLFPSLGRTGRVAEDMSQEINYGGFAKYAPMTEYLKRPEEGHGGQAMRAITSSSPVWSGTYMLYTGEHPHFKSPIFNEHDSTTLKIYKTFREQVKMLVPTRTYMPDTLSALHGWGDERIRSAEEGIERFGRKRAEEVWRAKLAANAGFPGVAYGNEFLKSFTGRGVAHTKREIFQDFDRLTRSYVLRKGRGALYLRTEADLRRELHSLGNDLKTLTERAGETWTPKAWDVDGMVELLNAERDKAHPERAQLRNTIRDTQQTLDKLLQSQQTTP